VLIGIPRGETHNGGGLLFATDGTLYVGTGDTGNAVLAQDPQSLAGKVLHVDVFGQAVGAGRVYSHGHADVTALCLSGEGALFATDDSAQGADELEQVDQGGDAGWPTPGPGSTAAVVQIPAAVAGLGGCAVSGRTVFLGALDGRRVHTVQLDPSGVAAEEPTSFLADRYGRLRTVVLDADGALWITTSNRDGIGTPAEDDDRVLRIFPPGGSSDSPL
jgi:glucose/arabinose dehydrogenase